MELVDVEYLLDYKNQGFKLVHFWEVLFDEVIAFDPVVVFCLECDIHSPLLEGRGSLEFDDGDTGGLDELHLFDVRNLG